MVYLNNYANLLYIYISQEEEVKLLDDIFGYKEHSVSFILKNPLAFSQP